MIGDAQTIAAVVKAAGGKVRISPSTLAAMGKVQLKSEMDPKTNDVILSVGPPQVTIDVAPISVRYEAKSNHGGRSR